MCFFSSTPLVQKQKQTNIFPNQKKSSHKKHNFQKKKHEFPTQPHISPRLSPLPPPQHHIPISLRLTLHLTSRDVFTAPALAARYKRMGWPASELWKGHLGVSKVDRKEGNKNGWRLRFFWGWCDISMYMYIDLYLSMIYIYIFMLGIYRCIAI